MNALSKALARVVVFVGQTTIFGRGSGRSVSLRVLRSIGCKSIDTKYHGVPYQFNLDNVTECNALFGRYNYEEMQFLLNYMVTPGVFVDIGANSGLYTQFLAACSPRGSRVIAIEPNPRMIARIRKNVSLLQANDKFPGNAVSVEEYAVGGTAGNSFLGLERGPGEAHVVDTPDQHSIQIRVKPLLDILVEDDVDRINCLKIDVEGYEDKVLVPFFNNAPKHMHPKAIVIEHSSHHQWKTNVIDMLGRLNYREIRRNRANAMLAI